MNSQTLEARPAVSPQRSQAASASEPARDALDQYMRSIRLAPVLGREETATLSKCIRDNQLAFCEAVSSLPSAVDWILSQWEARRDQGRVTGVMASAFRDGGDQDWSAKIDSELLTAARLRSEKPRAMVDERLVPVLREAALSFDVVKAAFRIAEATSKSASPTSKIARRVEDAKAALERRDAARRRFAFHNLKLVIHVARHYREFGVPYLDLIQEGNLGLVRAVEKFDPDRGFRFSTYAVWWIEQAMIRTIQRDSRSVRLPSQLYEQQAKLRRIEESLRGLSAQSPDEVELAEAMGTSAESFGQLLGHLAPTRSIHAPIGGAEDLTLEDTLTEEPVSSAESDSDESRLSEIVGRELGQLPEREHLILRLRFGLAGNEIHTLESIGNTLGLSRERVRQLELQAMGRLRELPNVAALSSYFDMGSERAAI